MAEQEKQPPKDNPLVRALSKSGTPAAATSPLVTALEAQSQGGQVGAAASSSPTGAAAPVRSQSFRERPVVPPKPDVPVVQRSPSLKPGGSSMGVLAMMRARTGSTVGTPVEPTTPPATTTTPEPAIKTAAPPAEPVVTPQPAAVAEPVVEPVLEAQQPAAVAVAESAKEPQAVLVNETATEPATQETLPAAATPSPEQSEDVSAMAAVDAPAASPEPTTAPAVVEDTVPSRTEPAPTPAPMVDADAPVTTPAPAPVAADAPAPTPAPTVDTDTAARTSAPMVDADTLAAVPTPALVEAADAPAPMDAPRTKDDAASDMPVPAIAADSPAPGSVTATAVAVTVAVALAPAPAAPRTNAVVDALSPVPTDRHAHDSSASNLNDDLVEEVLHANRPEIRKALAMSRSRSINSSLTDVNAASATSPPASPERESRDVPSSEPEQKAPSSSSSSRMTTTVAQIRGVAAARDVFLLRNSPSVPQRLAVFTALDTAPLAGSPASTERVREVEPLVRGVVARVRRELSLMEELSQRQNAPKTGSGQRLVLTQQSGDSLLAGPRSPTAAASRQAEMDDQRLTEALEPALEAMARVTTTSALPGPRPSLFAPLRSPTSASEISFEDAGARQPARRESSEEPLTLSPAASLAPPMMPLAPAPLTPAISNPATATSATSEDAPAGSATPPPTQHVAVAVPVFQVPAVWVNTITPTTPPASVDNRPPPKLINGRLELYQSRWFSKTLFKRWRKVHAAVTERELQIHASLSDKTVLLAVDLEQSYAWYSSTFDELTNACTIDLRTADGDVYVLRAPTAELAALWLGAFRTNGRLLDQLLAPHLSLDMPLPIGFTGKVIKMGWVRTRIDETPDWLWRYFIVTDFMLCLGLVAPKNNKDILRTPVKYFLSEMNVRSYLPNDLDIAAEDRPRTFMILSSRGAFFVRTELRTEMRSWFAALTVLAQTAILKQSDFMYRVELEGHKVNLLLRRTSGIHLLSKDGRHEFMRHPFEHFKRLKVAADVLQLDFGDYEAGVIDLRAPDSMAISIVLQSLAASTSVGPLQRTKTGSLWNSRERRAKVLAEEAGSSAADSGAGVAE